MVCSIGIPYSNLQDYAEDNLTTKSQVIANSRWFGCGAEKLGLSHQVTSLSYDNAHRGQDDNGNALRQHQTNKNSNPGRDLTFSAPKSVSLLALVQENNQAINAHDCAVDRALKYIEQNCIYTRVGKGGRHHQQTHNMIVAVFQHHDSRNLDPNLHSHCVIFNQTQGRDGKWRTIDNRQLYQQRITIGLVYHHELGQQLMELGHSIDWHQNGTFDLASFKPEQLQQFSSRRAEIISIAGANSSSKAKALACISTRINKKYIKIDQRKALRESWKDKLNLSALQISIQTSLMKEQVKENSIQLMSRQELIDSAIKALTSRENKTRFSQPELLREVLVQAQGQHKFDLIQRDLKQHLGLTPTENGMLTTLELYRKERQKIIENTRHSLSSQKEQSILQIATSILDTSLQSKSSSVKFTLKEICDHDSRMSQTLKDYLQCDEQQQSKTIILTDTEEDKHLITSSIRQELIQQNRLGSNSVTSIILQPKNINKIDLTKPDNYQVGNVVKFNRQSKKFSNQHFYKILSIDETNKILILGDRFGSKVELPLNRYQNREVFEIYTRDLRINENMQFSRGQYINSKQVYAGQTFTVTNIEDKQNITIKTKGKQSIVKTSDLFFTKYNYACTLKEYQSKNIDSCIYYPSAVKTNQSFKQDIYELASLTKATLTVYASNSFGEQVQSFQSKMEPIKQSNTESTNTVKSIDDILFELASSAKYIVLNEGQRSYSINQVENFELSDTDIGGLLDKTVYHSPDGVMIEKDPQNLSIYYDGKTLEFDQDYNVRRNDLTESKIRELNQKMQAIKQQSLERNRGKKVQQNIDLSI